MLKVEGLTGGYGSSKVLFGMAFEAAEGEVISLIGRNGMGKTTTIKTLMGMLPATGGQVQFRGQPAGDLGGGIHAAPQERGPSRRHRQ